MKNWGKYFGTINIESYINIKSFIYNQGAAWQSSNNFASNVL